MVFLYNNENMEAVMQHNTCKVSVTMSKELLNFISYYSKSHGDMNRSSVIQKALEILKAKELAKAYHSANAEIDSSFDTCTGDGLNAER